MSVEGKPRLAGGYARVSSHGQKDDLRTKTESIRVESAKAGHPVGNVLTDFGSGMNTRKRGFSKLIGMVLGGRARRLSPSTSTGSSDSDPTWASSSTRPWASGALFSEVQQGRHRRNSWSAIS